MSNNNDEDTVGSTFSETDMVKAVNEHNYYLGVDLERVSAPGVNG